MVEEMVRYFADLDSTTDFSDDGKLHFDRKLHYLTDGSLASTQWQGISYLLEKNNIDIKGKRVLDVGCGTGYTSIYFAIAGAKEVVGVDPRSTKIEAFHAFVSRLPDALRNSITIKEMNIQDIDYNDYFDLAYAQESISHIIDDDLFSRLHGMLRNNGALYISDSNNLLCRKYREEIFTYWQAVENGPTGQCGHHHVYITYKDIRKELIARYLEGDSVSSSEVNVLAENTAYMHGDMLRETCEQYRSSGAHPRQRYEYGTPPIHPEGGYFNEKLFNPYELKRELLRAGFTKCKLYGGLGLSKPWYVRPLIRAIPLRVKFGLRSGFKVIAIK